VGALPAALQRPQAAVERALADYVSNDVVN
jgi:hypothetical protein